MSKSKLGIFFFILCSILILFIIIYLKTTEKNISNNENVSQKSEEIIYSSNIIENVFYSTKDGKGNEYIIKADQGEIDYSNPNYIYLTNVEALIKLKDSNIININSNFGKYNTENYDTIFSKNVIIDYLENKITGEYLDFSLEKNQMIISKKVVYTNLENILRADVIEMNLETKDTKIFMYENSKKVNIKSKN
jgi:LPS export ABC transporter protein LptC